jgi:D-tyrosyl-tRNA(Tyr) deacylase
MNLSVSNINGSILIIPNFTLYADCEHGFRPRFQNALTPNESKPLFDIFVEKMKQKYDKVYSGIFGADMQITQQNDGPITIIIEK